MTPGRSDNRRERVCLLTGFTHLHVHSHYTLLGGAASVLELAARAKADGLAHLALTDANALYGAVQFVRACTQANIQPIIGMALTVAPEKAGASAEVMVLLATGPEGYRSLCRLSSLVQGQPERERLARLGIDWEALAQHSAGLLCLAGGRRGQVERLLRSGDTAGAARYVSRLAGAFDDRAYLALEIHRAADETAAMEVARLGQRFGLPTVAVQPVYCLHPSDRARLRLLTAIDLNCRLDAIPPASLPDQGDADIDLHWLTPAR